ncbi:MAG: hypothetical protein ACO36A_07110 [Ilumatobacteraceae bacterium]
MDSVRVHDDEPPRARERAAEIVRAARARLMIDRRTQTALAACLALVLTMAVRTMASSPGRAVGRDAGSPPTTVVVPPDHRVVTIPAGAPLPGVAPGSRVDLVARSSLLVADAVVTGTQESAVSVAVPAASAPAVAEAASIGEVWVVLRPG